MRLDVYLFKNGYTDSRSKAREIIKRGYVKVGNRIVTKPSFDVGEEDIRLVDSIRYVSRSGEKLEAAIRFFGIDVKNKLCLDVGASTGGFTQCLLYYGAKMVYAVDVGKEQLHPSLRKDKRVVSLEETDIREFKPKFLFDFACVDVSFISLRHILPHLFGLINRNGGAVVLFKPQFEVGRSYVKKGIAKDDTRIKLTIGNTVDFSKELGFYFKGIVRSPIKGKAGNQEYLLYFSK